VYAGWGLSQAFYWDRVFERLGFATLEDFIVGVWEPNFTDRDGDTHAALASVKARALVMPSNKDLYFPPEDEGWSVKNIPDTAPSNGWGMIAVGVSGEESDQLLDDRLGLFFGDARPLLGAGSRPLRRPGDAPTRGDRPPSAVPDQERSVPPAP
jgi:hypothetical protein